MAHLLAVWLGEAKAGSLSQDEAGTPFCITVDGETAVDLTGWLARVRRPGFAI